MRKTREAVFFCYITVLLLYYSTSPVNLLTEVLFHELLTDQPITSQHSAFSRQTRAQQIRLMAATLAPCNSVSSGIDERLKSTT